MQKIIAIHSGTARMPEWRLAAPVDFELAEGENIAIVGPNGAGKSLFVDMLTGAHPLFGDEPVYDFSPSKRQYVSDNIKHITFTDSYGENDSTYYLQQRWNQHDIDEETPRVGDILYKATTANGLDTDQAWVEHLYSLFEFRPLLDKYIILLSSGELRKMQVIKALLSKPRVLIIDNPFIGLDTETREQLKNLLGRLCGEQALQIILVLPQTDGLPEFITHVVEVTDKRVSRKMPRKNFNSDRMAAAEALTPEIDSMMGGLPYRSDPDFSTGEVVNMKKVRIQYGDRIILNSLDWVVNSGERWAVTGRNGAGKSTLMSLICADNPQSYACDIALFGKRRGSGESIWEIKKHIGYVSPEMHRAYKKNIAAVNIVASGLKESVGLYVKPTAEETAICLWWLRLFGIEDKAEQSFMKLSSGEQRLVLLARAFVKDPALLILDEPFHGLDNLNRTRVKAIIDAFCRRRNKTLIMISHFADEFPGCIDHSLTLTKQQ